MRNLDLFAKTLSLTIEILVYLTPPAAVQNIIQIAPVMHSYILVEFEKKLVLMVQRNSEAFRNGEIMLDSVQRKER